MPAEQAGSISQKGSGKSATFTVRYFDSNHKRVRKGGFSSPSKARAWFRDELARQQTKSLPPEPTTLSDHVDAYLEAHAVGRDPKTIDVLRDRLAYLTKTFGELRLDELERRVPELAAWMTTLPAGSRYGIVQAARQCLEAAVRWRLISTNPAKLAGSNPQPKRTEAVPFEPDEVERLAAELGPIYGPLVIVGAYCGLRPSELFGLEWRDVDLPGGVLTIERAFSYGQVKAPKTRGSRRRVPIPARAKAALEQLPRRLDTRLVFYGPRGAHIDVKNWRRREWQPACESSGLWMRPAKGQSGPPCPRPYTLRHSYASWMLAAGVPAYDVARYMGTSVRMLDLTYGHLVKGSETVARERLDAFTAAVDNQKEQTR